MTTKNAVNRQSITVPLVATLVIGSFLSCAVSLPVFAGGSTPVLKGNVTETGRLPVRGPTLNRSHDVDKNTDPFSGPDEDATLDAPKSMFKAEPTMAPPKRTQPLRGNADQDGQAQNPYREQRPAAAPVDMTGEQEPLPAAVAPPPVQQQPTFNPNDPDSSPDMQLAWDMWHKRVAATIFERFNFFAKAAFRHSPPLMAKISYAVTRDGQIVNMNMQQKSTNVLFNVLVFQSVKSLNGDMNVLPFPQGSRRMAVQKMGTFTQNYGQEGFRYTVGDSETIRAQQQQQQMRQMQR